MSIFLKKAGKERMFNNIAGAILAGGRNTRMGGKNKAFLNMNGIPIIQIIVSLFKELFSEIVYHKIYRFV